MAARYVGFRPLDMQGSATLALLDMCRFAPRCGVPQAPFCTPTRDKRKIRSLVPAIGFKIVRLSICFIQYEWPGLGPLTSSLLRYGGTKQKEKKINKAIHIDCPPCGQISGSRREHIEFPARETYRQNPSENGNPFLHFIYDGRNRMCLQAPRRRCRPIARKAGKYRVCLWQTYRVSRQGNISTERLGENSNFFYFLFVTGVIARETTKAL